MKPEHRTIVILNLGRDPALLSRRHIVLQSAGYFVESTSSIERALRYLCEGDFDLVVACHSLSNGDRAYLTKRIRGTGSAVPLVFMSTANVPCDDPSGPGMSGSEPSELLQNIEAVLRQGMSAGAR